MPQDLKHSEILLPRLQHMETTAIHLNSNKESISFSLVYNCPGTFIERVLGHVGTKLASNFDTKYVTWRARQNNAAGQSLLNHYYENNYVN
jgi:hypothetical protein